ncbi:hypothetical protein Leryth_023057 [Lithospermum erythrorhizon]|nr:hypothetical protein Leryth_023057 [Lithospermum erythrorhizon]
MERKLYDAAIKGDVYTLRELIHQDELILDRVILTCFNETPLHIATMKGHLEFVKEILRHNSMLTKELDSRKSSPLHMASLKGHLSIVKELVRVDPDMCFVGDRDGRNPLHLAAMKGRVEVLKLLVKMRFHAALKKTNRGETILHLCVKYDQIEALKIVLAAVDGGGGGGGEEVVVARDDGGNTILHLAVEGKQIEMIKYLVKNKKTNMNEQNGRGETALDILSQSQGDVIDLEISDIIREAGGLSAKDLHTQPSSSLSSNTGHNSSRDANLNQKNQTSGGGEWLSKKRDAIMVVASLIATMAFQAGMNPTGGVWQDDEGTRRAGESIMAHHNPRSYRYFIRANTISFVSSLSTILLLISGLPFRHRLVMWLLMMIMWLTITSSALTYAISIVVLTPHDQKHQLSRVIHIAVTVWCGVMALMLLGNTIRLILRSLKKRGKIDAAWPPSKWRKSIEVHH